METRVLRPGAANGWREWERFLQTASGATPYHRQRWLYAIAEGMNQDIRVHVVVDAGRITAGAVVRRGGVAGMRTGAKPWATAYNGPAVAPSAAPEHVDALYDALHKGYASVRLVHAPTEAALRCPWPVRPWSTPLLNLRDTAALWDRADRRMRQRVRKAQHLGVTVRSSRDTDTFEHLYRLTYSRQGIPLQLPEGSVAHVVALALAGGVVTLHEALTVDGEPAAALVVGRHVRQACFMLAASHPQLRKTDAMTLLWWTAFESLAGEVDTVDLVGAGTDGIDQFKRSFSPAIVHCVDASSGSLRWTVCRRAAALFGRQTHG